MAGRITKVTLTNQVPNLSALGITPEALGRFQVVEARTSAGRRIGIPYAEDAIKLMSYDGGYQWDGDYTPSLGLLGQRHATSRRLVLVAHEFEMFRLQTVFEANNINISPICVPQAQILDSLSLAIIVDQLRFVCDEVLVWHGSKVTTQVEALEAIAMAIDSNPDISVKSIRLSRCHSPLDLTDKEICRAIKGGTSEWYPSSVSNATEIFESTQFMEAELGLSSGIPRLDDMTKGIRLSELWMSTAGTGVGKSTLVRQIAYHLAFKEDVKVGLAFLEETRDETLKNMACLHFNLPLGELKRHPDALTKEQRDAFKKTKGFQNLRFITPPERGWGGMSVDNLLQSVQYLKTRHGVTHFIVDHLTLMISGVESSREGQVKDIDIMMTKLAMSVVLKQVFILCVSHLSNPQGGQAHEEGGRVLAQHLRGSGSLKQLSWCIIAQERDQQGDSNREVLLRILKNRNGGGITGPVCVMEFNDPWLVPSTKPITDFGKKSQNRGQAKGKMSVGERLFGESKKVSFLVDTDDTKKGET